MSHIISIALLFVIVTGCSTHRAAQLPPPAQAALSRVHVGMCEPEALLLLSRASLDWGRVYYGESGRERLYFQLSSTQQVWLDVTGPPDFRVTAIGEPEPKSKWT